MTPTVDVVVAGTAVRDAIIGTAATVNTAVRDAIIGTAATVNIMPLHTMKALRLKVTGPSTHSLISLCGDEIVPVGVIKDVPVDVGRIRILTTFYVLLVADPDNSYSLLLGTPWMLAGSSTITVDKDRAVVEIRKDSETVTFPQRKEDSDKKPKLFSSYFAIGRSLTSE